MIKKIYNMKYWHFFNLNVYLHMLFHIKNVIYFIEIEKRKRKKKKLIESFREYFFQLYNLINFFKVIILVPKSLKNNIRYRKLFSPCL